MALNDIKPDNSPSWICCILKGICLTNLLDHQGAWKNYKEANSQPSANNISHQLMYLQAIALMVEAIYCSDNINYTTDKRLLAIESATKIFIDLRKNFGNKKIDSKFITGIEIVDDFSCYWVDFYLLYADYVSSMLQIIDAYEANDVLFVIKLNGIQANNEKVKILEKKVKSHESHYRRLISVLNSFLDECRYIDNIKRLFKPDSKREYILTTNIEKNRFYCCEFLRRMTSTAINKYRSCSVRKVANYRSDIPQQALFEDKFKTVCLPFPNDFFLSTQYDKLKSLIRMYHGWVDQCFGGNYDRYPEKFLIFYEHLKSNIFISDYLDSTYVDIYEYAIDCCILDYLESHGYTDEKTYATQLISHDSKEFIHGYFSIKFRSTEEEKSTKIILCWENFKRKVGNGSKLCKSIDEWLSKYKSDQNKPPIQIRRRY